MFRVDRDAHGRFSLVLRFEEKDPAGHIDFADNACGRTRDGRRRRRRFDMTGP